MADTVLPLFLGLGAGVLAAWGVGGGTLLLAVMTLFLGVEQRTAQGINLLFFLPAAASGLMLHIRAGRVDRAVFRAAVPAALLGALAGAVLAAAVDTDLLRKPFGAGLVLCGVRTLWSARRQPAQEKTGENLRRPYRLF